MPSCTECCDLLRALLHEKQSRRLGLGQIMSHNWFMVVNLISAKNNQLLMGRNQKVQPVLFLFCFRSSYKTIPVGVFHAALRLAGCSGRLFHPSSGLCVLRGEQALCSVLHLGLRKQYLHLAVLLPEGCVNIVYMYILLLVAPFCFSIIVTPFLRFLPQLSKCQSSLPSKPKILKRFPAMAATHLS